MVSQRSSVNHTGASFWGSKLIPAIRDLFRGGLRPPSHPMPGDDSKILNRPRSRPSQGRCGGRGLACRRLRLRLYSLQFPFQPLQRSVNLIGSNRGLAVVAVAGVHEYGDVLQPFLNDIKVLIELPSLVDCLRVMMD